MLLTVVVNVTRAVIMYKPGGLLVKLDGVAPLMTEPPPISSTTLSEKKKKRKKNVTRDM